MTRADDDEVIITIKTASSHKRIYKVMGEIDRVYEDLMIFLTQKLDANAGDIVKKMQERVDKYNAEYERLLEGHAGNQA